MLLCTLHVASERSFSCDPELFLGFLFFLNQYFHLQLTVALESDLHMHACGITWRTKKAAVFETFIMFAFIFVPQFRVVPTMKYGISFTNHPVPHDKRLTEEKTRLFKRKAVIDLQFHRNTLQLLIVGIICLRRIAKLIWYQAINVVSSIFSDIRTCSQARSQVRQSYLEQRAMWDHISV